MAIKKINSPRRPKQSDPVKSKPVQTLFGLRNGIKATNVPKNIHIGPK